jgi:hypothetical protein
MVELLRKWAVIWKMLCFAILLLVCAEVITRIYLTSPSNQIYDARLGFVYQPDSVLFNASEGGAHLRLNHLGLNTDPIRPKEGRRRVWFLGDSITQAAQVPRHENFCSLLMKERPDLQAINGGRSDAGPLEYLEIYRRLKADIQADVVAIVLTDGDLADMKRAKYDLSRNKDHEIEDVQLHASARQRLKNMVQPLISRSALATHLMRRAKPLITQGGEIEFKETQITTSQVANGDQITIELLSYIIKTISKDQKTFVIHIPNISYEKNRRASVSPSSLQATRIFNAAATNSGTNLITLDTPFIESYRQCGQPGHGFMNAVIGAGHINALGHAAVAKHLGGALSGN